MTALQNALQPRFGAGARVLLRLADDGWFYPGVVRLVHGGDAYVVEDEDGSVEPAHSASMLAFAPGPRRTGDQACAHIHPSEHV